jgi:2-octaprenyl-6-methoxyphenol hydroxylase
MAAASFSPAETVDIAVVGAGLAGLAAALGFQRAGFSVICIGGAERAPPGRTVALFGASLDFLESLGVLGRVEAAGAPMRTLRIVDATGSLFAPRPLTFRASEIGRDAFGLNIENAILATILAESLPEAARWTGEVVDFDFAADSATLRAADGRSLSAKLVVGADGRASPTRKAAGIDMSQTRFAQSALTLLLRHSRPHDDASTEFHTREGPFTLVPLPGVGNAPHRSSLVWLMRNDNADRRRLLDDDALAAEIRAHSRAILGEVEIEGGRGLFPMSVQRVAQLTGLRVALVGDAAHAFPPIGAQGLNLGLRDVKAIVATAEQARDEGNDIGGAAALRGYAAARRPDIAMRTLAIGAVNLSLLAPFAPVDAVRGLGLTALAHLAPLRRAAMREGLNPFLAN